jgi:uncharacterized protein (DUF433 family)
MTDLNGFQYLEFRPRSSVRQPFVKGRGIWAETLYGHTEGEDARTPEQVVEDFEIPVGAVLEAIAYCKENEAFLLEERQRRRASLREFLKKHPPLLPPGL